jgi:hypothetical protein
MSLVPYTPLDPEREKQILEELLQERPVSPAAGSSVGSGAVELEPLAPRDGKDKKLFFFDKSLEDVRRRGYQRHARPQEAFGLVIDGLEGKLTGAAKQVGDDMLVSYGEWLSLAFERQGSRLVWYDDPENLAWDGQRNVYTWNRVPKYAGRREFGIGSLPSKKWIEGKDVPKDLFVALYGREWRALPQAMREGDKRAGLWLPAGRVAWPVGRGVFNGGYDVNGCNYIYRASRGVRPSAHKTP